MAPRRARIWLPDRAVFHLPSHQKRPGFVVVAVHLDVRQPHRGTLTHVVGGSKQQPVPGFWALYAGLGIVGILVCVVGLITSSFGWLTPFFGVVGVYYLVRGYVGRRAERQGDER